MKRKTTLLALLLNLLLSVSVQADVLPNDAVVGGQTIGEWSADWWKWVFSCPTNQNALMDTNGSNANNCQPEGPVFFLAGVFVISSTVTRTFTVPEGKYLFFPVVNIYCGDPGDPPRPEDCRDAAAGVITNYAELHASIDGVPVPNLIERRAISPVFSFEFPSCDNIMTVNNGFCISGLVDPLVSDGYWLMVEPLSPGAHVVNFGGTRNRPGAFQIDITAHITVVPIPLPQRVQELISLVAATDLPPNRQRPLLASLNAAEASFGSARALMSIHHLRTFQRKVRAQIAPSDVLLADELIQFAESIIQRAKETARAECPGRRPFGQ